MKIVRCIVSATNSNGEPDLYFVKVNCTQQQYDEGLHYERAKEQAEEEGYEAFLCYDENDSAGRAMLDLFDWNSATAVNI